MREFAGLFVFVVLFASSTTHADRAWHRYLEPNRHARLFSGLRACEKNILSFNKKRIGKILRQSERDLIGRLTDAPTERERRERLKFAYRYFFEKQLRGLSPDIQRWVRSLKIHRQDSAIPSAAFQLNDSDEWIDIKLPRKLWFSAFDYLFLSHEIEHAVQMLSAVDDYRQGRILYHRGLQTAHYIFLQESAAMSAEWEWLSALSPAAREDCVRDLRSRGYPWLGDWVQSASLGRKQFLRMQRSGGRYSLDNILDIQREDLGRIRFSELLGELRSSGD